MGVEHMWMVRAGRGGRLFQEFVERDIVALGWDQIGDPTSCTTLAALIQRFRAGYPDWSETQVAVGAGQMFRFIHEFRIGDGVITYDSQQRVYQTGTIIGPAKYISDEHEELRCIRAVKWGDVISRDALSQESRNTLGAIQTLFLLPDYSCIEIESRLAGETPPSASSPTAEADPYEAIHERALERLKDRIVHMEWHQVQDLVAALLRALGYRTKVSPQGADRGKDIFASPDGFGFERPRIVVEVKHRRGQTMGAPEVRSFLGGRHKDDRGLYVSTGGFTREAYYESERASIPVTQMTLDDLARAIMDNYEAFDTLGRSLVPLTRVYWLM